MIDDLRKKQRQHSNKKINLKKKVIKAQKQIIRKELKKKAKTMEDMKDEIDLNIAEINKDRVVEKKSQLNKSHLAFKKSSHRERESRRKSEFKISDDNQNLEEINKLSKYKTKTHKKINFKEKKQKVRKIKEFRKPQSRENFKEDPEENLDFERKLEQSVLFNTKKGKIQNIHVKIEKFDIHPKKAKKINILKQTKTKKMKTKKNNQKQAKNEIEDQENDDFIKNVNHFKTQMDVDKMFDEDFLPVDKNEAQVKLSDDQQKDFKKEFERKVKEKEMRIKKQQKQLSEGKHMSLKSKTKINIIHSLKINKKPMKTVCKKTIIKQVVLKKITPKIVIKNQVIRLKKIQKQVPMNPPRIHHIVHLTVQHSQKVNHNQVIHKNTQTITIRNQETHHSIKNKKKIESKNPNMEFSKQHIRIYKRHIRISNNKLKQKVDQIERNHRLKEYFKTQKESNTDQSHQIEVLLLSGIISLQKHPRLQKLMRIKQSIA